MLSHSGINKLHRCHLLIFVGPLNSLSVLEETWSGTWVSHLQVKCPGFWLLSHCKNNSVNSLVLPCRTSCIIPEEMWWFLCKTDEVTINFDTVWVIHAQSAFIMATNQFKPKNQSSAFLGLENDSFSVFSNTLPLFNVCHHKRTQSHIFEWVWSEKLNHDCSSSSILPLLRFIFKPSWKYLTHFSYILFPAYWSCTLLSRANLKCLGRVLLPTF